LGAALWGLFTSVNFAVLQIILLAVAAVVGMTVRQLPDMAFRSSNAYAEEIAKLQAHYAPAFGEGVVGFLEWAQAFQVFRSWWFGLGLLVLIISIVICTLDRTPRLWRQSADIRVVQPDPFFDPRLPDRARMVAPDVPAIREALRRNRFHVREAEVDGVRYLYGDRHRWTKLATLLTHLGLILFLVAAAITARFGFEEPLVIAEGDTQTVQNVGTAGLLLVRNVAFEAPGIETGQPSDFTTALVVYRDGVEVASKTIRVNDPLSVGGYTLHQNGFGPAPDIVIRETDGDVLWSGPVALTGTNDGLPYESMAIPGRDMGLALLLDRADDGRGILNVLAYRRVGEDPGGAPLYETLGSAQLQRGDVVSADAIDLTVELRDFREYTLLIAKADPGVNLVWIAFGSLILGLMITFYLPRRRVWTRLTPDGMLAIVGRSDRYVDFEREFRRLLGDLVAAGPAPRTPSGPQAPPPA
jgi:cytochrome c biogenesis protein